jgi:hypothetical protein
MRTKYLSIWREMARREKENLQLRKARRERVTKNPNRRISRMKTSKRHPRRTSLSSTDCPMW